MSSYPETTVFMMGNERHGRRNPLPDRQAIGWTYGKYPCGCRSFCGVLYPIWFELFRRYQAVGALRPGSFVFTNNIFTEEFVS